MQECSMKNSFELLGSAKALLPEWRRKSEINREMD